jgi:putative phosphoribosyl transferase
MKIRNPIMHPTAPQRLASPAKAGRNLATQLAKFAEYGNLVVLTLPNGGVLVGSVLAGILKAPFDVMLVREITSPDRDDAVLGFLTGGGVRILDYAMIDRLQVSDSELNAAILRESMELARLARFYRDGRPSVEIADRTVVLVDDGSTPCSKLRVAIRLARRQHAERLIVALPVTCHHVACDLRLETATVVTLAEPPSAAVVGKWMRHFPKVTHHEVRRLVTAVLHDGDSNEPPALPSRPVAQPATWAPVSPGYPATHRFSFWWPPQARWTEPSNHEQLP